MLPSLRLTTARCLPRYARPMSSSSDPAILAEAMGTLGVSTKAPPPPVVATPSSSSSSSPKTPTIMNIPPAEDPLLHYFTSSLLTHGHRARAARITSNTLLHIHAFTRAPPLPILRKAIEDAAPAVRSLMHKQGGKMVAKPVALGEKQRTRKAVQAILKASKTKMGRTVEERLARELIAIVQGKSVALDEKENIHKFAMVNRGNAQTRV
ncbi:ribosomal protein S7 domain-containing protein [Lyophyllum atratum]|nr:ribosomal protein S7 domain-containing protein [Lyophyllum atratum]